MPAKDLTLLAAGFAAGVLLMLLWPARQTYEQCMIDKMRNQAAAMSGWAYKACQHLQKVE